jgi:hypothetical protein
MMTIDDEYLGGGKVKGDAYQILPRVGMSVLIDEKQSEGSTYKRLFVCLLHFLDLN